MSTATERPPMPTMPWETLRALLLIVAKDHCDFVQWQPANDMERGIIYDPYLLPARQLCVEVAPYIHQIHKWRDELRERDRRIEALEKANIELQKANRYLENLLHYAGYNTDDL